MKIDFNKLNTIIVDGQCRIAKEKSTPHIWFAWYPVSVGYLEWVWLGNVVRQYDESHIAPTWYTRRYYNPQYEAIDDAVLQRLKK